MTVAFLPFIVASAGVSDQASGTIRVARVVESSEQFG